MTATVEDVANSPKPQRLSYLKVLWPEKEVFFLIISMVTVAFLIWMFASPIVKHTEFWSNVRWTLFFLAFSAIGPFMALIAVGLSPAIFTVTAGASLINALSEGVSFGKAAVDGAWAGLGAVLLIPLFLLFAGPYGLYHFTWQPIMQFLDGADHTLCCYDLDFYSPYRDKEYFPTFRLSPDGKWIVMLQKNSPTVGPENTLLYIVDTEKGGAVKWFGL